MELFKEKGIYKVRYRGADNRFHTSSTKESELTRAREVVKASGLEDIELAAKARSLTADSLSKIMAGRKVRCRDAYQEWGEWAKVNVDDTTLYNYDLVLRQLFDRTKLEASPITALDHQTLDTFINDKDEDVGLATRNLRLTVLRSFFMFCSAKGYCVGNPAHLIRVRVKQLSHEQKEPKKRLPITAAEYRKIITHAEGFEKFATILGYWLGLRLSDIACLEWSSFTDKEIVVWTRKRDARVAIPLNDPLVGGGELLPVLMELMLEHQQHPQYCFPEQREIILDNKKRAKLSVYYSRLLTSVGIEGKSFHGLRHSFADRFDKAGKSLEDIGRLLGHSSTETTKIYTHSKKK